jgi:hypothetical protein
MDEPTTVNAPVEQCPSGDPPTLVCDNALNRPMYDDKLVAQLTDAVSKKPSTKKLFNSFVNKFAQNHGFLTRVMRSETHKFLVCCQKCVLSVHPKGRHYDRDCFRFYFKAVKTKEGQFYQFIPKDSNLRYHRCDTAISNEPIPISTMSYLRADDDLYKELIEWVKQFNPQRDTIVDHVCQLYEAVGIIPTLVDTLVNTVRMDAGIIGLTPGEDLSALVELMIHERTMNGANFAHYKSENGTLTRLFFQSQTMRARWRRCAQFIVMDCTNSTNTYSYPLCLIVCNDENNVTQMLAWALIETESTNAFEWVIDCLRDSMDDDAISMVATVATDGCQAMINAIKSKFSKDVKLMRCLWHLKKNANGKASGKDLTTAQERLIECARAYTEAGYAKRMTEFKEWSNGKGDALRNWVDELDKIKENWAFAYTRHITTFDATTTQRIESYNRVVKVTKVNGQCVGSKAQFVPFFKCILKVERNTMAKSEEKASKQLIKNQPIVQRLDFARLDELTPHAVSLILQANTDSTTCTVQNMLVNELLTNSGKKVHEYFVDRMRTNKTTNQPFTVTFRVIIGDNCMGCSCGEPVRMLLPCCHVVAANKTH